MVLQLYLIFFNSMSMLFCRGWMARMSDYFDRRSKAMFFIEEADLQYVVIDP